MIRRHIALATLLLSACALATLLLPACAAHPPQQAKAPTPAAPPPASTANQPPPETSDAQVPAAPETCSAFETRAPQLACPEPAQRLVALDQALSLSNELDRSAGLAALELCPAYEKGLLLALRVELVPLECADAVIEKALGESPGLSPALHELLLAQTIAGRLARLGASPPAPPAGKLDRQAFGDYFKQQLVPWLRREAHAIETLARRATKLNGYAKGFAAIEAGRADLRLVDAMRQIPLPEELASDKELSEVYGQALEEALEPRKTRGRDASLVGLLYFAQTGILDDARLHRVRAQLVRLFAGSRIDALDVLLLPNLGPRLTATPEQRLAATLPTFYAGQLLPAESALDPAILRALLERGLPPAMRDALEHQAKLPPAVARLYARALLALGTRYFRPADFNRAAELATVAAGTKDSGRDEARLLAALATALRGGPENAVQLMLKGPLLPEGMGNLQALEQLARERTATGALAEFDAAHLLSILPQMQGQRARWLDIAARFERAAKTLPEREQQVRALSRAEDAEATAAELSEDSSLTPVKLPLK